MNFGGIVQTPKAESLTWEEGNVSGEDHIGEAHATLAGNASSSSDGGSMSHKRSTNTYDASLHGKLTVVGS